MKIDYQMDVPKIVLTIKPFVSNRKKVLVKEREGDSAVKLLTKKTLMMTMMKIMMLMMKGWYK